MIHPKILDAVLMAATKENKDVILKELVKHIALNYDYNDEKAGHIIGMLIDSKDIITSNKVNINWVKEHLDRLMYKHEEYNIRNISIESVDNIDCTVKFNFEYIKKVDADKEDAVYNTSYSLVSFIDYPDMLKC